MTKAMNTTSETALQIERRIFPLVLEPPQTAAPATSACRKRRADWIGRVLNAGWMALMLSCAGECVYRLLWAVQP